MSDGGECVAGTGSRVRVSVGSRAGNTGAGTDLSIVERIESLRRGSGSEAIDASVEEEAVLREELSSGCENCTVTEFRRARPSAAGQGPSRCEF